MVTSSLRLDDVAASFWSNRDFIIASCARCKLKFVRAFLYGLFVMMSKYIWGVGTHIHRWGWGWGNHYQTANVGRINKWGDKHVAASYRPVFLTCDSCRLLEHKIYDFCAIMDHVDWHNILKLFNICLELNTVVRPNWLIWLRSQPMGLIIINN